MPADQLRADAPAPVRRQHLEQRDERRQHAVAHGGDEPDDAVRPRVVVDRQDDRFAARAGAR